jgi:UDP-N-acetylmuramate--alanine ligase
LAEQTSDHQNMLDNIMHHLATPADRKPFSAHLVGIGGSGMRALAAVLVERGWKITGSDLQPNAAEGLIARGVRVCTGHASGHVPADAELLIYSDAVPVENPERQQAQQRGIPIRSYAQMLGELASQSQAAEGQLLAVAGTHGKSTVTAMAAEMLIRAGLDPTVVCGAAPISGNVVQRKSKGQLNPSGLCSATAGIGHDTARRLDETGGRHGEGKFMLVEACEYRENFLQLRPNLAVLLNIEADHFDYYHSTEQLQNAFSRFVGQTPDDGLIIASQECSVANKIATGSGRQVVTFGFSRAADWRATNLEHRLGRYRFDVVRHGQKLCHVTLAVTGRHNVLNALAAAALARHCGVSAQHISQGLAAFCGLERRLEVRSRWGGVPWIDDYAHHPTEVKAALATVRQMFPRRRIWCVFQPHQASRLAALLDELATSLHNADRIAVAEVFRAREGQAQPGEATAADLAILLAAGGNEVLDEHHPSAIARRLCNELQPGDVLVTMGAGDLGKIFHEFHERLRRNCAVA